jgi:hypothetical protein
MKKLLILVLIVMTAACSDEEENTPNVPVDDDFDPTEMNVTLIKEGLLMGVGHAVTGEVKVYSSGGQLIVVLDPFSSQNGPDLKVYLSKDEKATEYLNLGALKSTNGKQSYEVSGAPDLTQYKYVMVWCQQFSVLFGIAELE